MSQQPTKYDTGTQLFHGVSAALIIVMLPLGFLMQKGSGTAKLVLYRAHVSMGLVVLLFTLARIVWRMRHVSPEPLTLSRPHHLGMEGIHVLLYAVLLILAASGVAMLALSTLPEVLKGAVTVFPNLSDLAPRKVHGAGARIYIALLVAHVGGVVQYQLTKGDTLGRIGLKLLGQR